MTLNTPKAILDILWMLWSLDVAVLDVTYFWCFDSHPLCVVHFCLGPTVVYPNHVGYSPLCSLNHLQFAFTLAVLAIECYHCLSNLTNAEQWRRKVIYAGWSTEISAPLREVSLHMGGGTVRQWNGFMLSLVEAMGAKLCPQWNSAST